MELKDLFLQPLTRNEKTSVHSGKLKCPYCQEKDLSQLVKVGEKNIKCMSCCNFYDCYFNEA